MKKNHLFIAKSNANKPKISRAKKIVGLSVFLLLAIVALITASVPNHILGFSGTALAFLPMIAMVKGTIETNGIDETDEQFAARGGKAEDPEVFVKRYLNFLKGEIAIAKDNPAVSKELNALKSSIEAMKGQADVVAALKEEVKKANLKIESALEKQSTEKRMDITSQVKAWYEANKTALESIKSGNKAELKPLTLKVNSPMTPGNTYSASTYLPQVEYVPGVTEIVRVEPTLWDYIRKGSTSSATLVWVNKYTPLGAADFIAPGVAKPGVSFQLQSEVSNAKKVAVSAKTTTELLDDIPGMNTFIQQELQYQLRNQLNAAVMSGTASATDINGIQTLATTFTLAGVSTANPNNWDAILACVAQLRSGNLQGPVTVFVNPVDYANMMLTKASSQGQLFVPANPGATIVQDNNVTVGNVVVALLDYYKIDIYQDMIIKWGWEEDDFTKNLITAICESRIHQRFSANHTGAFIYDTFANIKTAITAP